MDQAELHKRIVAGEATLEEVEDYLGPDLMNELAHRWRGEEHSRSLFTQWYRDVIGPIGLDARAAWRMFSGQGTIEEFAAGLTPEEEERFVEMFPGLQAAHQARIEAGEVR